MHELGIVDDLVKSLLAQIKNKNISAVKKIYVQLGKKALLSEESLKECFKHASEGTELENVALEVSLIDGQEIRIDSLEVS